MRAHYAWALRYHRRNIREAAKCLAENHFPSATPIEALTTISGAEEALFFAQLAIRATGGKIPLRFIPEIDGDHGPKTIPLVPRWIRDAKRAAKDAVYAI
jgi:hypothetical protein